MATQQPELDWTKMLASAGPYPLDAFQFVRDGLGHTVSHIHRDAEEDEGLDAGDSSRHVSGQQLCIGLRDYAIRQFGMMAPLVLGHWNIRRTDDFGRIVFAMIEHGLMSRTDEDSLDDFRSVYEFDEAFADDELIARLITSSAGR